MNKLGLAYATLQQLLEDWADENPDIVKNSDRFARMVTTMIFEDFLGFESDEIEIED